MVGRVAEVAGVEMRLDVLSVLSYLSNGSATKHSEYEMLVSSLATIYSSLLSTATPSAWWVLANRSAALTLSIQKPFLPSPSASAFLALSRMTHPISRACVWTLQET